jgi:hypothetical protein
VLSLGEQSWVWTEREGDVCRSWEMFAVLDFCNGPVSVESTWMCVICVGTDSTTEYGTEHILYTHTYLPVVVRVLSMAPSIFYIYTHIDYLC